MLSKQMEFLGHTACAVQRAKLDMLELREYMHMCICLMISSYISIPAKYN